MPQIDAAFVIHVIGGHVVLADLIIKTLTWPSHGRNHIVPWRKLGDLCSHFQDLSKTFMLRNKKVITGRGLSVFGSVNFLVGTIYSHP
jgi:hypothetical protein